MKMICLSQPCREVIWNTSHNEDGDTMGTTFPMEDLEHLVDFLPEGHRETPYMEFKAWS